MNKILLGICLSLFFIQCRQAAKEDYAPASVDRNMLADSAVAQPELAQEIDLSTKTPADKKFTKTGILKFKVRNVLYASEKIEDLAAKYDGYMTYSNLQNRQENYNSSRISRDSLLITKQVVVYNDMELRIPNEQLDSFVRELNPLVVFFDYRIIKLNDVTLQFKANQKRTDRLQNFEQRQVRHIDSRNAKLKETSSAEDQLLARQYQADDLKIRAMELEDQVKYCNLAIEIYQKPVILKEVIADFNYVSDVKPGFFIRIIDSIVQGWTILEEVIIFLFKIWGVILLIAVIIVGVRYFMKWYRKAKK